MAMAAAKTADSRQRFIDAAIRHRLRDKEPTPNGGEALFCFAIMLTLAWFSIRLLAGKGLGRAECSTAFAELCNPRQSLQNRYRWARVRL